jgi:hypothetical protein
MAHRKTYATTDRRTLNYAMRHRLLAFVFTTFASLIAVRAQVVEIVAEEPPELSVMLEPGPLVSGVPVTFTFHLRNVGQKDLRIPEPNVDCRNPTMNGSVWLNESWQPSTGNGLGKGSGVCDFAGSDLPSPPFMDVARKWRLLKPGESLYIRAVQAQLHYDSTNPGAYTFSAVYLPPSLGKEQERVLQDAGIAVPRHKAMSASLHYKK